MKIKNYSFFLVSWLIFSGAFGAPLFSDYGQIQNVPAYSTNPANRYGTPYNQKFPQAIYAQGTDLNTSDCQNVVATLVASYCGNVNNCAGLTLSDVRPALMVQLSRLPGHNYASACAGFLDSEFGNYVKKYGNAGHGNGVFFPTATVPNNSAQGSEFKIENPYAIKPNEWQKEYLDRMNELEDLQSQNGAGTEHVVKADFPTTFSDLSFPERMDVLQAGYAPYKNATAYAKVDIETAEKYAQRVYENRRNYCNALYGTRLALLESDLNMARQCQKKGIPVAKCQLQGRY